MKNVFKKAISILVCAALLSSFGVLFASSATSSVTVYVHGSQDYYKTDENGNRTQIFDDADYLTDMLPDLVKPALKGLTTGDWTEYADTVMDAISPAFEGFAPNPDGTLPEESDIGWSWSYDTLKPERSYLSGQPTYVFHPDVRLSPLTVADQLNEFITAVKQKTGVSKVHLWGRCAGTGIVSAYLMKYEQPRNYEGVASVVLLDGAMNGIGYMDALFSGNVVLPTDASDRFIRTYKPEEISLGEEGSDMAELVGFLMDLAQLLHETGSFRLATIPVQKLYDQLKDILIAKLAKQWWAICLGHVAAVNEHFEDYITYIFAEEGDTEKYANIISQAREYHETVQLHLNELLLEANAAGVPVNIIGEYGFQQYPLYEDAELIGEHQTGLREQSFGATVSTVEGTLSEKYVNRRAAEGKGKYISPDRQIDASTCLFPDNTWFVKNADHTYPDAINRLMATLNLHPDATVDTLEGYGQFMNWRKEGDKLEPAQEVNDNDMVWETREPGSGREGVTARIGAFLVKIITYVRGIIEGIVAHAKGTAA